MQALPPLEDLFREETLNYLKQHPSFDDIKKNCLSNCPEALLTPIQNYLFNALQADLKKMRQTQESEILAKQRQEDEVEGTQDAKELKSDEKQREITNAKLSIIQEKVLSLNSDIERSRAKIQALRAEEDTAQNSANDFEIRQLAPLQCSEQRAKKSLEKAEAALNRYHELNKDLDRLTKEIQGQPLKEQELNHKLHQLNNSINETEQKISRLQERIEKNKKNRLYAEMAVGAAALVGGIVSSLNHQNQVVSSQRPEQRAVVIQSPSSHHHGRGPTSYQPHTHGRSSANTYPAVYISESNTEDFSLYQDLNQQKDSLIDLLNRRDLALIENQRFMQKKIDTNQELISSQQALAKLDSLNTLTINLNFEQKEYQKIQEELRKTKNIFDEKQTLTRYAQRQLAAAYEVENHFKDELAQQKATETQLFDLLSTLDRKQQQRERRFQNRKSHKETLENAAFDPKALSPDNLSLYQEKEKKAVTQLEGEFELLSKTAEHLAAASFIHHLLEIFKERNALSAMYSQEEQNALFAIANIMQNSLQLKKLVEVHEKRLTDRQTELAKCQIAWENYLDSDRRYRELRTKYIEAEQTQKQLETQQAQLSRKIKSFRVVKKLALSLFFIGSALSFISLIATASLLSFSLLSFVVSKIIIRSKEKAQDKIGQTLHTHGIAQSKLQIEANSLNQLKGDFQKRSEATGNIEADIQKERKTIESLRENIQGNFLHAKTIFPQQTINDLSYYAPKLPPFNFFSNHKRESGGNDHPELPRSGFQ